MSLRSFPISTQTPLWSVADPERPPRLGSREVHVWTAVVQENRHPAEESVSILAPAEQERFRRFSHRRDAAAFLSRRVFLKVLLAGYLEGDPVQISFAARCASCGSTGHGKPHLTSPRTDHGLEFSTSSSKGRVLVGICRVSPLGVDVEKVAPELPVAELLAYAGSPEERRAVSALPEAGQASSFTLLWALKEAYLKALGIGLSRHPRELSVLCRENQPRLMLDRCGDSRQDWRLAAAALDQHRLALAHVGDRNVSWLRPLASSNW